jgi:hypothetical protein
MAEIINLRRARKARAQVDKETLAAENRVRFGRTGEERRRREAEESLAKRRLEGHRREDPPEPDDPAAERR